MSSTSVGRDLLPSQKRCHHTAASKPGDLPRIYCAAIIDGRCGSADMDLTFEIFTVRLAVLSCRLQRLSNLDSPLQAIC